MDEINNTIHPEDEMMTFLSSSGKSEKDYLISGQLDFKWFFEIIEKHRPSFLKNKSILDYGCGHGRITRYITKMLSPEKLVAADVWGSAVNFCAEQFNSTPFLISNNNTITKLGLKYDIIISFSVFSHLPPQSFESNLIELKNSLNDDGILLFTTHGKYHSDLNKLSLKDGFHYGSLSKQPNHTGGRLSGDEYSFMCVTKEFVEKILDKIGLKLLDHIQDTVKFKRQELYVVELKK